ASHRRHVWRSPRHRGQDPSGNRRAGVSRHVGLQSGRINPQKTMAVPIPEILVCHEIFVSASRTWKRGPVFLAGAFSLLLVASADAEMIRTAVPRASLNYLSIYVAEAKGLFKDEGLENETIVIGGPAAIAALVSGNVDFSGAGGSGLRAAAKGAELKAIFYQTEKVTWYFVVHPSIKSVADLKGKKVAVGLIGDSEDRFSTMFVENNGLSAKDITRIPMGTSSGARIAAIKSGSLQAAVLDPGGMIV